MSGSDGGPIEAAVSIFLLVLMLVIAYAMYVTTQGGDPSGVINLFSDVAVPLFTGLIIVAIVLAVISEISL